MIKGGNSVYPIRKSSGGWHWQKGLSELIDNVDERHFYEIESVKNDWSLCKLKRQYDSSLYERLALNTNKDKVYCLAIEGQMVEAR